MALKLDTLSTECENRYKLRKLLSCDCGEGPIIKVYSKLRKQGKVPTYSSHVGRGEGVAVVPTTMILPFGGSVIVHCALNITRSQTTNIRRKMR